jgi:hypothetical protein
MSFLFFIWLKPGSRHVYLPEYFPHFLFFLAIWIAVSIAIDKYRLYKKETIKDILFPVIMGDVIILAAVVTLMFAFQQFDFSRMIVFGTIFLSILGEIILGYAYYYNKKLSRDAEKLDAFIQARQMEKPFREGLKDESAGLKTPGSTPPVNKDLIISEAGEEVYNLIHDHIDVEHDHTLVISTTTRFNIDNQPDNTFRNIVNLRLVNDFKRINKFFESVNAKLPFDGIYINSVMTNELKKERILRKYVPGLNYIYYFLYFIFMRIFPKLPVTKKFYFFITNGYNRAISKAETFGRLFSCGFELVDDHQAGNTLYFVAKKTHYPAFDYYPTYGPLIRLKRIGKNGRIIYVYKMRTMHPYAEYLQDYVYQKHDLEEGGKFRNDFRVSTIGGIMRKLWIDELPMLLNLLRGDLKLVGVRPLSSHYFDLYGEELKALRIRHRPGLIPPFYADLPRTLEEIQESEFRYLRACEKHPLLTDWRYFWKAIDRKSVV